MGVVKGEVERMARQMKRMRPILLTPRQRMAQGRMMTTKNSMPKRQLGMARYARGMR